MGFKDENIRVGVAIGTFSVKTSDARTLDCPPFYDVEQICSKLYPFLQILTAIVIFF